MAHYYRQNAESCHEVVGANGKVRPTHVGDARKLKLVPSYTTVAEVAAKPMLINWMQDQILNACIDRPYHPDEYDVKQYKAMMSDTARKIGRDAADRGSKVHAILDEYFVNGVLDAVYTEPVQLKLNEAFGRDVCWVSEKSFAHKLGFGGRVDLYSPSHNIIVDFKTKDKEDIASVLAYDEYKMQLSAYQIGLELPPETRRFNLFISVAKWHEGECNLVEHKASDYEQHSNMFLALLQYWKVKNKYNSEF